ncbi:MAG: methionyl-tRNA formyltransferase [Treponema sp.]|nr:methionyl-tRNA formyltransferase [Treponema sp.]
MRILFAGSPAIAVPSLKAVAFMAENNFFLVGLLTNPDSPKGRSGTPEPTECAAAARQFFPSLVVLKPEKLDSAARDLVAELKPDILVSFAYGRIFGPKFLGLFPLGGINIHPSLLPKYRGPTPIPAAIINRDTETGITIQRLAAEMDSGDIFVQEKLPLDGRETTASLSETMAQKAAELLPAALEGIMTETLQAREQDHSMAVYCSLIKKQDGLINWNSSALEIDAKIRAFDPWPLSWTTHGELRLFILKAEPYGGDTGNGQRKTPGEVLGKDKDKGILIQTGEGILAVSRLQYQGKKAMEWNAFLNGARNFLGAKLGTAFH